MNPLVDLYLQEGCGRCSLGGTPQCKVYKWPNELELLRKVVLDCGLNEELKWSVPCYTYLDKNILIVSAFKAYCALSFFKGSLLSDAHKLLQKPGDNSQASRSILFTSLETITAFKPILKTYIFEAIEVEKAGLKVPQQTLDAFQIPDFFQNKMVGFPKLKTAFDALSPGRKKSYLLHFAQAKQQKTLENRIEKCIEPILKGKGFNER
jgi:uncharacterized protein YdeI (YjbR/CyaY-like superfamily)